MSTVVVSSSHSAHPAWEVPVVVYYRNIQDEIAQSLSWNCRCLADRISQSIGRLSMTKCYNISMALSAVYCEEICSDPKAAGQAFVSRGLWPVRVHSQ